MTLILKSQQESQTYSAKAVMVVILQYAKCALRDLASATAFVFLAERACLIVQNVQMVKWINAVSAIIRLLRWMMLENAQNVGPKVAGSRTKR